MTISADGGVNRPRYCARCPLFATTTQGVGGHATLLVQGFATRHRRCQAERCNRFFSTNAHVQAFGARSFRVARVLRRRPQFALKPSQGISRSHRVDQIDRDLIDEIARGTFEGTNVKTGGAGRDARQHHCCLAFRTRRSLNGHEACLDPAGAQYSLSPMDAYGGGDGP